MHKLVIAGAALSAALATGVVGYRLGAGAWPLSHADQHSAPSIKGEDKRAVLYWKHPDGKADFSPSPRKTDNGRDYVPVYDNEEATFKEAKPEQAAAKQGRRILYYRNPMGLPDTSPVPKKDWMGMDYIAVYEGEQDGSTVRVSLDRVQRSGVRTETAEMRRLARPVHASAIAKPDERTLRTITLRADGFIEKLYANETGKHVQAGEPLFRVYSPQIVSAQVDLRAAPNNPGGQQRLKNFDLPESVLAQIRSSPTAVLSFDWPSPVTGVIMKKDVIEGQMVKAGQEMFRLADLSSIWLIADVAEQDLGQITTGAPAKVNFRAFPGESSSGEVTFILHELEMATRTGKVRIEVKNPEHRIRHEMFADVEIDAGANDMPRLAVPTSAVIDSGARQVVIVDRGEGRFEPRPVKVGIRGDGFVEVREGLQQGDRIVVSANFLIDAESNLKAALKAFTSDASKPEGPKP